MIPESLVALRSRFDCEETMLQILRPTPTCTRFQTSIEMPCIKCGTQMRLTLIEPRDRDFDLLIYHCTSCDTGECFLNRPMP
jgi:hypothetical protein